MKVAMRWHVKKQTDNNEGILISKFREEREGMATETFYKEIIIDDEAADRLIAEMEKPRKPYVPKHDMAEVERSAREWLQRYRSKKSLAQKTK
jgi:hypothetical protein